MKRTCLILAIICVALAIVGLTLNLLPEQPKVRVSEMSDQQLKDFIRKYDLDRYDEAFDLEKLRALALSFEKYGYVDVAMRLMNFIDPYWFALTNALADYYDLPEYAISTDHVG